MATKIIIIILVKYIFFGVEGGVHTFFLWHLASLTLIHWELSCECTKQYRKAGYCTLELVIKMNLFFEHRSI